MKNLYIEYKNKSQRRFDNFEGIAFAFSKEQFKKGMEKLGLTENDTDKVVSIGYGGFMLKSKIDDYKKMNQELEDEKAELMKNDEFLYQMFRYELANHEYCITFDYEPTLDSLNLTYDEVVKDARLHNALIRARRDYLDSVDY